VSAPRAFVVAPRLDPHLITEAPRPGEVLLINPFYRKDEHTSFGKHVLTPSLALTAIAGATPASYRVRYWDENLLQGPPPARPFPEVVGITVHLTFARRAYELADWYRLRGARVVLGGLHVNARPEEAAAHADVVVTGEGQSVWPQVLADLRRGQHRSRYHGSFRSPYALAPAPDRGILPRASFLTTTSLVATRGCVNRCDFCYLATQGLDAPYQALAVEEVVRQVEADGQPYVVFTDNNLGASRPYLHRLCRALAPLRRLWSAAVTIDVTDDPALIAAMAASGCTGVFVGFESLTAENLVAAGKRTSAPADYARRVAIFHEHGIQVNGSFVIGFDHDRSDCFTRILEWVEAVKLECATYHILTPYPGTPLFRRLAAEDRILHTDWDLYDTAHVVFRPRHLSPDELLAGYHRLYRETFSLSSIWRRRPEARAAALSYLAQNLLYKKCNRFWEGLIRLRLVHVAWRPLIEFNRWRFFAGVAAPAPHVFSGGVPSAIRPRRSVAAPCEALHDARRRSIPDERTCS